MQRCGTFRLHIRKVNTCRRNQGEGRVGALQLPEESLGGTGPTTGGALQALRGVKKRRRMLLWLVGGFCGGCAAAADSDSLCGGEGGGDLGWWWSARGVVGPTTTSGGCGGVFAGTSLSSVADPATAFAGSSPASIKALLLLWSSISSADTSVGAHTTLGNRMASVNRAPQIGKSTRNIAGSLSPARRFPAAWRADKLAERCSRFLYNREPMFD